MHSKISSAAHMVGAALAVVGLSLLGTTPLGGAQTTPERETSTPTASAATASATTKSSSDQTSADETSADETTASKSSSAGNVQAATKYGWGKVVAGDEFSYVGKPDQRKWGVYDSAGHNGHGKRRPSAWYVDGTVATVTGDSGGTTGGMSSRYSQKYGRWEARMKTNDRDAQYHPNILLWPDRQTSKCPEVNFAESTKDKKFIKFFLHYGCAPSQTRAVKAINMTQWHNYAVEWTPNRITGYIDGVPWFTDTNRGHLPTGSMHAAIQLDWFRSGKTPKTTHMSVAWMRIYKA